MHMLLQVASNDMKRAAHQAGVMEVKTHGVGSTLATDCPSVASDVNHLEAHTARQQMYLPAKKQRSSIRDNDCDAIQSIPGPPNAKSISIQVAVS